MANAFDSTNYPTIEPDAVYAGDRWQWKRTDLGADYAPASYALSYDFRLQGQGFSHFSITASESGTDYVIEVAAATTVVYATGTYQWTASITRTSDSERVAVGSGTMEVRPDRATDGADPRSAMRIALDNVVSVIKGTATKEQASYSVAGRSLARRTPEELKDLYHFLRSEVFKEEHAERLRKGQPARNQLGARL